jgi:hypothetical protein
MNMSVEMKTWMRKMVKWERVRGAAEQLISSEDAARSGLLGNIEMELLF